jgi:hypothetical protein
MSVVNLINSVNNMAKSSQPSEKDLMAEEGYRDACRDVFNEAMEKGLDVIQMENGDIITTGTELVVNIFSWDASKKKMAITKSTKTIISEE